jgi:hypothetical protein
MKRFTVYQDKGQWVPLFNWFWIRPSETGTGHGPFPCRLLAWVSGWLHA